MKLGYPCLNLSLDCTSAGTFRLASYSRERVLEVGNRNLDCLKEMLLYNIEHQLLFFRISANIIPFASHPVMDVDWAYELRDKFKDIKQLIAAHNIRISIHAHAAVWVTSPKETTYDNSLRELMYNAQLLDLLGLDESSKLQIHMGSFFGDKEATFDRFAERYAAMPESLKRRLVMENTERFFRLPECLEMHKLTGMPILFDTLHHVIGDTGESFREAMQLASATWRPKDGIPMIDFSSQNVEKKVGAHATTLDPGEFANFLAETDGIDYDVMFEIKDKETSANKAVEVARSDSRFTGLPLPG
ncbi:UV DNA damage repair endonuclease UvsE [Candidatus Saccharibacteria bacterium]|nr:MAG: UV DNA damage repair endonuclease UvsE [Candidatus Saccharibacteria bacterium]